MALKTEHSDIVAGQELWIGRTVRSMAGLAPLDFDWCMLIGKRALFVSVTFDTLHITGHGVTHIAWHKSAVMVVAVGALHPTFRHFMMKRFLE